MYSMTKLGKYSILFCFLLANQLAMTQSVKHFIGLDSTLVEVFPDSMFYELSPDSAAIYVKEYLISRSYLLASCDSIVSDGMEDSLYFYRGPKIFWMRPSIDSASMTLLKFSAEEIPSSTLSSMELLAWRNRIIRSFSEKGFP